MKLAITYFAAARELAGCANEQVELAVAAANVVELRAWLTDAKPRLAPYLGRMRFAINGELASDDASLWDGDVVMVLPPVAGGSVLAEVRERTLSVDEVLAHVQHPGAGGVVVFLGVVRDHADGKAVARLDYEAYVELANKEMRRIVDALTSEHPGTRVAAVHRVGELNVGDTAVIVAASAAHRGDAFAVCRAAIDRIKATVPIWKKEWSPDGGALWVNLERDDRK
jgi:molybdopterin synthase catalytic subunit/molybdopterin converting factor small subunit